MNNEIKETSVRQIAEKKYSDARNNLILMIAFTLINLVLLVVGSESMLLFSASVPYFTVIIGIGSEIQEILMACVAIAAVILILYLLCWIFSKKHYGWMIVALILFIIDSICMCALYIFAEDISGIFDVIIHIWVLYYLIIGVKYGIQLKKMPEEAIEEISREEKDNKIFQNNIEGESTILRKADENVKHRVLLESDALGHHICYRRVKRINELVIDGYVYDDVEMLVESSHSLNAVIAGHKIQVGYDGGINSYLRIDGETVLKKKRFY